MQLEFELLARLVLSCVLGGIIGFERRSRHKAAGLRTNVMVCLGACLIMVLSQSLYLEVEGKTNADPARLAAQVVSGIGFLGAGAIMKEGLTVTGLTTAACLWVVACVGLAVGAGCYAGAFLTTFLVVFSLLLFGRMESMLIHDLHLNVTMTISQEPGMLRSICKELDTFGVSVSNVDVMPHEEPGRMITTLQLYNPQGAKRLLLLDTLNTIPGIRDVQITN